jgi:hypothetical protein
MNGHYHLQITTADDETKFVNEHDIKAAARKAKRHVSKGGRLTGYAFICEYGCGMYHNFKRDEVTQLLASFPGHTPKQLEGQHS